MIFKLQINNSDDRALNKNITDVVTLSGYLNNETSLLDLTINIEGDVTQLSRCNYITIPDLNRSYFIKDITALRNNLIQIKAHIDVLYTYRAQILNQVAVIGRQEDKYNLYMDDSSWYVTCKKQRKVINFPTPFQTNDNLILTVIGGC